jgi:hypothetical protein
VELDGKRSETILGNEPQEEEINPRQQQDTLLATITQTGRRKIE